MPRPGVSLRFMGINEKAVSSYPVMTYHAVALGVLESVEV
ncbi:hypothetical protein AB0F17_26755 [Nonomuraea sp. NPDC026600]